MPNTAEADRRRDWGWLAASIYRGDVVDFDDLALDDRRDVARRLGREFSGNPDSPQASVDPVNEAYALEAEA